MFLVLISRKDASICLDSIKTYVRSKFFETTTLLLFVRNKPHFIYKLSIHKCIQKQCTYFLLKNIFATFDIVFYVRVMN